MAAGAFGYLGYDTVRYVEKLPEAKPDPNGGATGTIADVPGFVVAAPADLSADDAKDKDKAKAYEDAKKAADDYAAAAKLEPLAVKRLMR